MKGYLYVYHPTHPARTRHNKVALHRLVAEQKIGRYLRPGEVVHHKNKNVLDNRPENLEVFESNGAHLAEELAGQVPNWSPEGLSVLEAVRQKIARDRRQARQRKRTDSPQPETDVQGSL